MNNDRLCLICGLSLGKHNMKRHYRVAHGADPRDLVYCLVPKVALRPLQSKQTVDASTQTPTEEIKPEDNFNKLAHAVYEKYLETACLGCSWDLEFAEIGITLPGGHDYGCRATPAKVLERYLPLILKQTGFYYEPADIVLMCTHILPVIENIMTFPPLGLT